jgi:hypothetical protein
MTVNGYDYPDMCIISRANGTTDVNGDEILTELYNGCCEIQYGGSGGGSSLHASNYQSDTTLFIPSNGVLFSINDKVVVISMNGRTSEYTIKQFESISDLAPELNDTCIWLKGGTDE